MQKHVLKFILLETLHREIYQKDVEEEFQIRKSTATGILQLMEKNGFIYRESSEKDARLKTIVPTKKAEALRAEILENIRVMEKRLTKGISEEEFSMCMYVLWKMFDNLAQTETKQSEKKGGKTKTMNRTLLKSIREYKKQSVLAPLFVILEVFMEV